ncbi:unnamed protein product [Didymodactylos carnosus]|uniref:Peptidase A1 domain-containing protein n=1 Tax=Didymodactylos carnosus TaxID=1234261 RepID=A0A814VWC2_9BILA|nr:unnamed protein product [Didymodactylos carnosus]CAF1340617.1 unnamed protein product [Didymodactylos carnosus]CAF3957974.1 unnamed protein product [Didymodactylos carnosus]CAF4151887.1 unnamed protein product [Didymodactylos carnosus]
MHSKALLLSLTCNIFVLVPLIKVAGLSVKGQIFAGINEASGMKENLYDGILGLAYQSLAQTGSAPLFFNMYKQKLIKQPIFSFYFNPNTPTHLVSVSVGERSLSILLRASQSGELILGGTDISKYQGSITYTPVNIKGYWEFSMNSVSVGSKKICSSGCYAISDTGTTLIQGPAAQVKQLQQLLGAVYESHTRLYFVDCESRLLSSFPNVIFTIGNKAFILTPLQYLIILPVGNKQYLCYTVFTAGDNRDASKKLFWILGDAFLTRFYSIYDIGKNRLGFAKSTLYNSLQTVPAGVFKSG